MTPAPTTRPRIQGRRRGRSGRAAVGDMVPERKEIHYHGNIATSCALQRASSREPQSNLEPCPLGFRHLFTTDLLMILLCCLTGTAVSGILSLPGTYSLSSFCGYRPTTDNPQYSCCCCCCYLSVPLLYLPVTPWPSS